jgi:hypothetical protein
MAKDLHPKIGMMVHTCNPSYLGGRDQMILSLQPAWAKLVIPYLKKKKVKRIGDESSDIA